MKRLAPNPVKVCAMRDVDIFHNSRIPDAGSTDYAVQPVIDAAECGKQDYRAP